MTALLYRELFSLVHLLLANASLSYLRPYTTHPYTLLIGSSRVRYTILEDYLRFVPKWSEKCNFHSDPLPVIDLSADVHEDAGHTLVHYLNTGTYQTLTLPGKPGISQSLAEYKTSVLVYCIAKNHGLPDLETLAKLHVTASGECLPFFDLLDITAAVYEDIPAKEQWFLTFLKSTIDAAFRNDRDLFRRDAFLNRIGTNRSFNLVLVNSIVRNLAKNNETTVELVMPPTTELDPIAAEAKLESAEEERLAAEMEDSLSKKASVATKEDLFLTNWTSSALEQRGRSPEPHASAMNDPDTPSSHQSEGMSGGETARTQPVDAAPKDDRTSIDDNCALPDLSTENVKPKVKKFKNKNIKNTTGWNFASATEPVTAVEPEFGLDNTHTKHDWNFPSAAEPVAAIEPEFGLDNAPIKYDWSFPSAAEQVAAVEDDVGLVEVVRTETDFGNWAQGTTDPPLQAEENILLPPKKDKKKGKRVIMSPPPPPPPPPASCGFTSKHLKTEGWKHCVPCRARVRQLGEQLKQDEALNEIF